MTRAEKMDVLKSLKDELTRLEKETEEYFDEYDPIDDDDNYDSFALFVIGRLIKDFQDRGG